MNRHFKQLLLHGASGLGLLSLCRYKTRSHLRIVTYHGVDDRTHRIINLDRLQADPAVFTRQIETLARNFQPVDLGQAVRQYLAQGTWPKRGLAITFDDGYLNNLEIAAPILKRIGVPATFFVTAGFIDGKTTPWWYDLRQWLTDQPGMLPEIASAKAIHEEARLKPMSEADRNDILSQLGVTKRSNGFYSFMTREDCRSLVTMGFDVQCHGDTHASFAGESTDRVKKEIQASVNFIHNLGIKPWGLAYPYGHEPGDMKAAEEEMKAGGIVAAFTTTEGANAMRANPWCLRRWDIHGGYSALGALARVS